MYVKLSHCFGEANVGLDFFGDFLLGVDLFLGEPNLPRAEPKLPDFVEGDFGEDRPLLAFLV